MRVGLTWLSITATKGQGQDVRWQVWGGTGEGGAEMRRSKSSFTATGDRKSERSAHSADGQMASVQPRAAPALVVSPPMGCCRIP